ncbi:MAG: hypothetical protein PHT87_04465 [Bacteroidales bacterium]|jgi:dimeric dUTPase (all-alpha-NTP-PPase superfamily)|nr:hypothetical protein [Bacteroidales bacterium]MDD2618033.1 hypothetical protein [Bacteroidales bacterium]
MLFPGEKHHYLSDRLGYYVKTKRLINLRKGIYVKPAFNPLELANRLYTPSYISLEFVLQKAGIIFQYDSGITCVSYLSRKLEIDDYTLVYRRIKEEIIMDNTGIFQSPDNINMASPERAFLDLLYLNKDFYFDNTQSLDKQLIARILPGYRSAALERRVEKILKNA